MDPGRRSAPDRVTPPGGQEDAEQVARAVRGDASAHRVLDDMEDVVQEAFVRAFQNLGGLKEPARFGPWLLTIARNRALTRLARRRSSQDAADGLKREVEAQEEGVEQSDPTAGAEVEVVRRIIAELPDGPEKETVHLFYVEGNLSAREIADRLGVGKSAITMRLERFRAKVKKKVLAEVARLRGDES